MSFWFDCDGCRDRQRPKDLDETAPVLNFWQLPFCRSRPKRLFFVATFSEISATRPNLDTLKRHSPRHHWWYFPHMTKDQAILLKTYDSETDGCARFIGHTAFDDPDTPRDAPMRESIEIRTIAFF
jgi:hypothetical protein